MFDIVEKAGVSQTEFGKMAKVSRLTAHKWITGKARPSPLLEKRVAKLLGVLQAAVDAGDLPIDATRAERPKALVSAIRKHMN